MMEKLGAPQTHLALKEMIKEVDEDFDGKIDFREVQGLVFLLADKFAIVVWVEDICRSIISFFCKKFCALIG